MGNSLKNFIKNAFNDMAENAMAQHEVDRANFEAVKTESKAYFEEVKAQSNPKIRKAAEQAERDAQIAEAKQRTAEAQKRIDIAKDINK